MQLLFFILLAALFCWAMVLLVWSRKISLQKVVAMGFLICLISLYFMLLASENNGSTGLGGLTFWLGVIVVLIGLLNKEE